MSPKIRRTGISRARRSIRRAQPVSSRRVSSPARRTIRRAVNNRRVQQRTIRRVARVNRGAARVRPTVRPGARPVRIMPARPTPARGRRPAPRVVRAPRPAARPRAQVKPRSTARGSRVAKQALVGGGLAAAALVLNSAAAHPDIASEVSALQLGLSNLQTGSSFEDLVAEIERLDADMKHALRLLESARDKGYAFQKDLDDLAIEGMSQWQKVQEPVMELVRQKAQNFQTSLNPLGPQIQQLNRSLQNPKVAVPLLQTTQSQVNGLLNDLNSTRREIESQYGEVETIVRTLNARLATIHWVLNQLEEAQFELKKGEDIVMAVQARWDQEGDDDPEGVVFLSTQRLIFERKEKIATKKILFITTASELVQEVLIDEPVSQLQSIKAVNKGLFGNQDFLEIDFANKKLGSVSLHLNGQDSEDWARWIDKVRSGKIETDRSTGTGLSFADLSGSLSEADIIALQKEINQLQDEMMLKDPRGELEELENEVRSLERQLADVRAKGYAVEGDLEADLAVLVPQWERIRKNAEATIDYQTKLLGEQMQTIQAQAARLAGMAANLTAARPVYMQVKSTIASAEAQADAAEDTVLTQYDDYAEEIEALSAHLDWVNWMLEALSTASFKLLATESGVGAIEAAWEAPGREPENGVLFLTDQRLLWEDRVGTFELKVDIPLKQVFEVKKETSEEELAEWLVVTFTDDAPLPKARFSLSSPVADSWVKMIGRARNGDYNRDRAVEIDPAELERFKNAPTQCPNCGAAFTSPILRGQTEITCEFCGAVTRF